MTGTTTIQVTVSVISLLQLGLILMVFATVSETPANVPLLAVAIISMFLMMLALGLATAGVTPEHAQVATLPPSLGIIAVINWVAITGTDNLTLLKRLLPGGAAAELLVSAWNGGTPLTDSLLLLTPTLAWVLVAVALASRMFRWEPRR